MGAGGSPGRRVAMPRGHSPDLRERVRLACEEEGLSAGAAAGRCRIGERTVHRWRRVARREGRRQATPHAGGSLPARKRCSVSSAPRATPPRRQSRLTFTRGAPASAPRAYVARFSGLACAETRKTLRAAARARPDVQTERAAFRSEGGALHPDRFVDASGVLTTRVRLHARAPKGQRASDSAPAGRG